MSITLIAIAIFGYIFQVLEKVARKKMKDDIFPKKMTLGMYSLNTYWKDLQNIVLSKGEYPK